MKIESTIELGKLIRDTRKTQGLTQSDLAIACGVPKLFYGWYEGLVAE